MWSLRLNNLHRSFFGALCLLLPVQLGAHFWPNFAYVMGLRIDYLAPTIYLTDLLVVVILGLWGLDCWRIRELRITNYELRKYWWILAVFVLLLAGSLLAQNQRAALYKFAKIAEFSLLGLYVAKSRETRDVIRKTLSIAVLYSSLIALVQFFKQSSLGDLFWWLGERTFTVATPGIAKAVVNGELLMRPYATFSHPNALAGFLLVGLILTLPYFLQRHKLFTIPYTLFPILAIALSFSRSVWLVGLLVAFFCLFRKKKFFLVISYLLLVISCLLLVTSYSADEAISQRLQLIKAAVLMIQGNLLAGVGLNNFLVRLPEFWGPIGTTFWLQPVHNIYLLIAAETGLTGLLVFLWFLVLTFKKLSILHSPLSIALGAILLLGLADHYWLTLQQNQLLFALVLGLSWEGQRGLKS
ncbi:hypothetical protein COT65_00210 [Candidatus Shapirobacteria bacterium CG09_land_8_20_14_0_10_47_13]|uniref:O-antigen ligase-related domain-containing protein n=1 Tax=Candidatus Shapirobacteria bacterium CG09_land_8_20_14_0_10_47_13 TaxID=1974481 RepID=A0A2H0WQM3_9BACT|nr:MAG: hypothetical protein COT65_00210 [Candidatus Shapirobacteria bacterium CG09_land_8_20_14_0_10_47_13]